MSGLVPRTILKKSNEKHSIKPLPVEKPDIGAIDWTAPQSLSNGCSVRSNHESMVVGKVGRIPNLFGFGNLDVDVLRRRCRSFRALPEPDSFDFKSEESHELCRQGTRKWRELHLGVLTSGNILGALGFKEAHVVNKIGLNQESASHRDLVHVQNVLRQSVAVEACDDDEVERTRTRNATVVREYNESIKREMMDDDDDDDDGWDVCSTSSSASASASEGSDDDGDDYDDVDDDAEDGVVGKGDSDEIFFSRTKEESNGENNSRQQHFDFSSTTPLEILIASVHRQKKAFNVKKTTNNAKKGGKKSKNKQQNKKQKHSAKKRKKAAQKMRELSITEEEQAFGGTQGLSRLGFCRLKAREGEQSVRLAWGNTAEAGALLQLLDNYPNVEEIQEVGLCRLSKESLRRYEDLCGCKLPPIGASPDAIALIRNDETNTVERVVVEVKNRSPFYRTHSGYYRVGDPPLPKTIPAYHVPQVQLEMVSANATSCLLCMRNVTRGMAVFRVKRDEDYLKRMFQVIGRLYEDYVLKDHAKPLPENWLANDPVHAELVRRTKEIAENAELVVVLEPERGADFEEPFLDF